MLSSKKIPVMAVALAMILFSFCTWDSRPLNQVKKVVIDAGHGGKDPGTGGGKEKRYALDIALKLGDKIKKEMKDVEVIYTRNSDVFIPLNERAAIANRNKADLFISIHCNAHTTPNASGTETYIMGLHKTEANLNLAKRENNVILMEDNYQKSYKGFNPNSPLAHIMLANYQSAFMNQSMDFASRVESQFRHQGYKSRGVKQAGFLVIWETTMPSVLIETGYLSNPSDARVLASETGRTRKAEAIYQAFRSYKNDVEQNQ
ncbi:N-acetylmuramoyl-L-alanine amidase family protein [Jiulongibacter sp. NS-SX5]|uniref:N-acetylmuramoyl-L-alanine amidase family protein n=1 Tax=Jiulongibacter sp. NS-SX5 TaxID=3463854 RepID=UPI004058717F